jgi:hypothetical protein
MLLLKILMLLLLISALCVWIFSNKDFAIAYTLGVQIVLLIYTILTMK